MIIIEFINKKNEKITDVFDYEFDVKKVVKRIEESLKRGIRMGVNINNVPFRKNTRSTRLGKGGSKPLINTSRLVNSITSRATSQEGEVFLKDTKYPRSNMTVNKVAKLMMGGTSPHTIFPRKKNGVLRFFQKGKPIFAKRVRHPGTYKYNFFGFGTRVDKDLNTFLSKLIRKKK